MEARGKYVWDPDKQAWVRPTEPKAGGKPAEVSQSSVEPLMESEPIEAAVEPDSEAGAVEAAIEAEGLELKGAGLRLAGVVIDIVILLIVNALLTWAFGTQGPEETARSLPGWVTIVLSFAYFVGFWSWRGQTPGKMILRAKVVKTDGSSISVVNALLRWVFYFIPFFGPVFMLARFIPYLDIILPIVAFLIIALSSNKRGPHDWVAGTCVVDSHAEAPVAETPTEESGPGG